MSIAWSTIVVVVLLLPGFAFLAGFYLPKNITQEAAPISPLGQLGALVSIAFFLHVASYFVINEGLCTATGAAVPCVVPDRFVAVLRADTASSAPVGASPTSSAATVLGPMFDLHAGWIAVYFLTTSTLGLGLGALTGFLIERGPLRLLARNGWLYELQDVSRDPLGLLRAWVLSKTVHDGRCLVYQGIVHALHVKASGNVDHLMLKDASTSVLEITTQVPLHHVAHAVAMASNPDEPAQFLFIECRKIANIYFEKAVKVTTGPDDEQHLRELARNIGDPTYGHAAI